MNGLNTNTNKILRFNIGENQRTTQANETIHDVNFACLSIIEWVGDSNNVGSEA